MYFRGLVSVFLGIFMMTNVHARDTAGYFGVEGGLGFADIRADETASVFVNTFGGIVNYEYDEADLAGRLSIGYGKNDMFDIELGYFFTADFNATYNGVAGNGVVYSATETYSASGIDISALIRPNSGDFFVRVGMHNSEVEGQGNFVIPGVGSANVSAKQSGSGLLVGLGYDWSLDDRSFARVSYSFYDKLGGIDNSELGLLSASYNFGF